MRCFFNEPLIGQCKNEAVDGGMCCDKHSKEKCQVCGRQATTRCQASIGVMCGVPLCDMCGAGQMCLDHATQGPLMVIRALLGGGPVLSVFSTPESIAEQEATMKAAAERLRKRQCSIEQLTAELDANRGKE